MTNGGEFSITLNVLLMVVCFHWQIALLYSSLEFICSFSLLDKEFEVVYCSSYLEYSPLRTYALLTLDTYIYLTSKVNISGLFQTTN